LIEMQMVKRMAKKAMFLVPVLVAVLWFFGGWVWALSGAIGVAMTLANLWFSARIIGGVADNNPTLLLIAAMGAFTLGLALLGGIGFALQALEIVEFPVVGFTLIGTHLVLVISEAGHTYPIRKSDGSEKVANARS
jgi:hypothetical protein